MNWIDKNTAILIDSSILNFFDDGKVEFYGSKNWKKVKNNGNKTRKIEEIQENKIIYNYDSREKAIKIWENVEKLLIQEEENDKH